MPNLPKTLHLGRRLLTAEYRPRTSHRRAMRDMPRPTVRRLDGPSELLPLISSFAGLSSGTEFGSYREPQWRFLLSGEDMTGFVIHSGDAVPGIDGCVLKVHLDDNTTGFGMVLVRPSQRGRGLAKSLLREAMNEEVERGKRAVLAVCSTMGQPLYRKLSFKDDGAVTALTCSVADLKKGPRVRPESDSLLVLDGKSCTAEQLEALVDRDARATGTRRRDRMKLLLHGYADGSRSTVAFLPTPGTADLDSYSIGAARQDCASGPLFVGPVMGNEEYFLPLVHALVEKHFDCYRDGRNEIDDASIVMMIAGHPNLVNEVLKIDGMKRLWECPSMSSDGMPVYQNGDGSYLAMMHPTLG